MSTSKMFSEFLVEQNLVSADDLVSILIDQAKTLPIPAEVVRSQKLLTDEQILTVFAQQMKSGGDFCKACQELNLWNPALSAALSSENERLRIPVVQILQSMGKVSTEKLVLALDTYLSEQARPAAKLESVKAEVLTAVPILNAAPSTDDNDDSLEHFREFYSEAVQDRMISLAKTWDQSELDVTNALIDRVHGIVGAARFAKLIEIEEIFRNAESNIRALADCATPLPLASIEAFRSELCQAFEKAWNLREAASGKGFEQTEAAV